MLQHLGVIFRVIKYGIIQGTSVVATYGITTITLARHIHKYIDTYHKHAITIHHDHMTFICILINIFIIHIL